MSKGGDLHNEIKAYAHKLLLERGFKESQIFEEHPIKIGRRKFIVDVVGISEEKQVAVECGEVSSKDKLTILRTYFDEVIHLPYVNESLKKRKIVLPDTYEYKILIFTDVKKDEHFLNKYGSKGFYIEYAKVIPNPDYEATLVIIMEKENRGPIANTEPKE